MSDIPVSAADAVVPTRPSELVSIDAVRMSLIALLVASFAIIVLGVFRQATSGDEYIFLNVIHRAANGDRVGLLQTSYAHLFAWLPLVGQDEIFQIRLGRLINVALWTGSLTLLYGLGRRLLDPIGALAGVVLFAVFSFSLANAASFRIDGLLLPVLLSVALLLLNPTVGRVAAAGALSGLAVAMSIKAVLWAPAFIGVLAVGLWNRQERLRPILAGALAGAVTCVGIMLIHARLTSLDLADIPATVGQGSSVAGRYMLLNGFVPKWEVLGYAVVTNPVTWVLLAIGICLALAGLRQAQSRRCSLILLLLALPILSVTFYTNAFPYAYLVLMPTACLLAGLAFSKFTANERVGRIAALSCIALAAVSMATFVWNHRSDSQLQQRQVISAVHQLFPEPVPYIDRGGMVASFPRPTLNMTWFGINLYRRNGSSALSSYIQRNKPPFLIVNTNFLQVWNEEVLESVGTRLHPQDEETIRATYAHYWDQIYLAGRQWQNLAAGESRSFEIVVPGEHTLIANDSVIVNGEAFEPWTTIRLDEGPHELQTTAAEPDLRILWGTRLVPLEDLPPSLADAEQ